MINKSVSPYHASEEVLKLVTGRVFVYGYTGINRYVDSEYGNVESNGNLLSFTNMHQKIFRFL